MFSFTEPLLNRSSAAAIHLCVYDWTRERLNASNARERSPSSLDVPICDEYAQWNVAASNMIGADFDVIYRKYGAIVQRRAWGILGDEQSAKDAVQEVFIRAIRSRENFRGEASVTSWIYRITTNYCLNVIRDRARRVELLAANAVAEVAFEPTTDSQIAVSRVLAQLPEELREIAVYFFVDQMNRDEIAALLGVSRRTIGYRLEEFRTLVRDITGASPREAAR